MRLIHFSFILSLSILFFFSCSEKKQEIPFSEKFTNYIESNKEVIFSGKVDIQAFLRDADYSHIPKLNALIASELQAFKKGIYLDSGIYFTVEGLLSSDGIPNKLLVFATVKNNDSIRDEISSLGLMLEHTNNMDMAIGEKFSVGIQNNVVLFYFNKQAQVSVQQMAKVFNQLSRVNTKKISSKKTPTGALVLRTHLNHLYTLYAKEVNIQLDALKKKEVNTLFQDSYLQSTLTFSGGGITVKTQHHFSESLQKRMIFNSKNDLNPKHVFPYGKANIGLSLQFDPLKIQTFIEDFIPHLFEQISASNSNLSFALFALGDNPITNLLGGKLGYLYFASDDSHAAFLEFGEHGKNIAGFARTFLSSNPDYRFSISDSQLLAHTKNHLVSSSLQLPNYANTFGKNSIDFFVDFNAILQHNVNLQETYPFLNALDYMTFTANREGSVLRIQAKNRQKGILQQEIEMYIGMIQGLIQGV
jgi:hypothetical protein